MQESHTLRRHPALAAFVVLVFWGFVCEIVGISEEAPVVVSCMAIVIIGIVAGARCILRASGSARRQLIFEETLLVVCGAIGVLAICCGWLI